MSQIGNLPQIWGENEKYLKPPPRYCNPLLGTAIYKRHICPLCVFTSTNSIENILPGVKNCSILGVSTFVGDDEPAN